MSVGEVCPWTRRRWSQLGSETPVSEAVVSQSDCLLDILLCVYGQLAYFL